MSLTRRTFAGIWAAASALAQDVTFRSDVRLVRLLATVKDAAGSLIGGLEKSDFTVYDNGIKQEVVVFERHTEQPLSVAILLDISGSTAKELRYEFDSLDRFLKALFGGGNPQDHASLFSFNYEVYRLTGFTRRLKRLQDAMRSVRAEAGTSLYDALHLASKEISQREGRRVLVVITDGGDTTSRIDFHEALESVQRADAVIYAILVVPITNDSGRNVGGENALAQFAAGTGGRVFQPTLGAQLDKAFDEILRDLRTQYMVAYYPKNLPETKNRFHTLKLEVGRPGLRVQTRSGYYGDSNSSARPATSGRGPTSIP